MPEGLCGVCGGWVRTAKLGLILGLCGLGSPFVTN